MAKRHILIYLAIKYKGDWDAMYEFIKTRPTFNMAEVYRVCDELKCEAITIFDDEYPEALKNVFKPPFVLFYKGDISLLYNTRMILGVVGSRLPDNQSILQTTKEMISNLKKDIVVISGMAMGIDGMAHRGAIEGKLKTIAVLGSGIDVCYPSENLDIYEEIKSKHLLISEYPLGVAPSQENFPKRNRIIAGLCHALFVPACKVKSGTMITICLSLSYGKDILCLPSEALNDSGCNFCIKNGAYLVENAEDINEFFVPKNYYGG